MEYIGYQLAKALPLAFIVCVLSSLGWRFGRQLGWMIAPLVIFFVLLVGSFGAVHSQVKSVGLSSPNMGSYSPFLLAGLVVAPLVFAYALSLAEDAKVWTDVSAYEKRHPILIYFYLAAAQLILFALSLGFFQLASIKLIPHAYRDPISTGQVPGIFGDYWFLPWALLLFGVAAYFEKQSNKAAITPYWRAVAASTSTSPPQTSLSSGGYISEEQAKSSPWVRNIEKEHQIDVREKSSNVSEETSSSARQKIDEWIALSEQLDVLRSKGLVNDGEFALKKEAIRQNVLALHAELGMASPDVEVQNALDPAPTVTPDPALTVTADIAPTVGPDFSPKSTMYLAPTVTPDAELTATHVEQDKASRAKSLVNDEKFERSMSEIGREISQGSSSHQNPVDENTEVKPGGTPLVKGPVVAVATCLKKYAVFSGRASRSEFWYFFLFGTVTAVSLSGLIGISPESTALALLAGSVWLALLLPSIAVYIRRLHDINKTGWYFLFYPAFYLLFVVGNVGITAANANWAAATWAKMQGQPVQEYSDLPLYLGIFGLIGSLVLLVVILIQLCSRGTAGRNRYG